MKKLYSLVVILALASLWSANLYADYGPSNHSQWNTVLSNGRPYYHDGRWWSLYDPTVVTSQGTYNAGTHYDRRPFIYPPACGTLYYDAILHFVNLTFDTTKVNTVVSRSAANENTETQDNVSSSSSEYYANWSTNYQTVETNRENVTETILNPGNNPTITPINSTDTTKTWTKRVQITWQNTVVTTTYHKNGKTYTKTIVTATCDSTNVVDSITTVNIRNNTSVHSNSYINIYSWIHPAAYTASNITPPTSHTDGRGHLVEEVGEWEINDTPLGRDKLAEDNEWHTYAHHGMVDAFAERLSIKQYEGTSWNVETRNVRMAMAPHLRLQDGTKFGSVNMTEYIPRSTMIRDTGMTTVYFRSFLTDTIEGGNGTIRIEGVSGDTALFRIYDKDNTSAYDLQVGTNKCGVFDKTANDVAELLSTNDSIFPIRFYFCPVNHDATVHQARFKISNGPREAYVTVHGNVDFEPLKLSVTKVNYDMQARHSNVNTASYQADMLQDLIDHDGLTCNYDDVVYTFKNGVPTNVARISTDGKIDVYHKAQFSFDIVATSEKAKLTAGNITTASLTIILTNIPYGTMHFQGNQNTEYYNKGNWDRPDWIPTLDQDVSIDAVCYFNHTSDATDSIQGEGDIKEESNTDRRRCHDFTITENGQFTMHSHAEYDVQGVAVNDDAQKLVFEAGPHSRSTFRHHQGTPAATVNVYLKGHVQDATSTNGMDWQYRGCIGTADPMSIADVNAFQWDETLNASNCWINYQQNNLRLTPWVGYAIDNHTAQARTVSYTTHLIPTESGHTYNLTRTVTGRPNEGVNLITNSYACPIRPRQLTFNNVEQQIWLYNTSTHDQYEADWAAQIVAVPVVTATAAGLDTLIHAGQSFAVRATADGATLTVPHRAIASHYSGEMHAPEEELEFNVLGIRVAKDGRLADRVVLIESDLCTDGYDDGFDGTKQLAAQSVTALYATTSFGRTSVNASQSMIGTYVGFHAGRAETEYTMTFETEKLEGYGELYLHDNQTGADVDILAGESYTFRGTTGLDDRRFTILGSRIISDVESAAEELNAIRVADNRAFIQGHEGETLRIIDMQGRVLTTITAHDQMELDLSAFAKGVYMITAGDQTVKFIR